MTSPDGLIAEAALWMPIPITMSPMRLVYTTNWVALGTGIVAIVGVVVCVKWQGAAADNLARRLSGDPEHLQRILDELRREYGGSLPPLGRGDGVPLLPQDLRANALLSLLADRSGAEVLARVIRSERDEAKIFCDLHQEALKPDLTTIGYGLPVINKPYSQARKVLFPHARYFSGGCVVGEAREAIVLCCPMCNAAEKAWTDSQR